MFNGSEIPDRSNGSLLSPIAPLFEEGQWPKRTLLSWKFRFKNKLVNLDSTVIDLYATPCSNFLVVLSR
jgi:hypothetical protein